MRLTPLILLPALLACSAPAQTTSGWQLVWSDEFNSPAGTPPDPKNWNYDLGGGGWGNGEAETYTNSPGNVFQDGKGHLVIRAIRDASGNYTSARLQTGAPGASTQTAHLSWKYGRIEARIQLPFGKAVWPAFWMLGENIGSAGWPACGEVDIMENFGTFNNNISTNNGTAHGPGYSGAAGLSESYTLPFGQKVADDFHLYAIECPTRSSGTVPNLRRADACRRQDCCRIRVRIADLFPDSVGDGSLDVGEHQGDAERSRQQHRARHDCGDHRSFAVSE